MTTRQDFIAGYIRNQAWHVYTSELEKEAGAAGRRIVDILMKRFAKTIPELTEKQTLRNVPNTLSSLVHDSPFLPEVSNSMTNTRNTELREALMAKLRTMAVASAEKGESAFQYDNQKVDLLDLIRNAKFKQAPDPRLHKSIAARLGKVLDEMPVKLKEDPSLAPVSNPGVVPQLWEGVKNILPDKDRLSLAGYFDPKTRKVALSPVDLLAPTSIPATQRHEVGHGIMHYLPTQDPNLADDFSNLLYSQFNRIKDGRNAAYYGRYGTLSPEQATRFIKTEAPAYWFQHRLAPFPAKLAPDYFKDTASVKGLPFESTPTIARTFREMSERVKYEGGKPYKPLKSDIIENATKE